MTPIEKEMSDLCESRSLDFFEQSCLILKEAYGTKEGINGAVLLGLYMITAGAAAVYHFLPHNEAEQAIAHFLRSARKA